MWTSWLGCGMGIRILLRRIGRGSWRLWNERFKAAERVQSGTKNALGAKGWLLEGMIMHRRLYNMYSHTHRRRYDGTGLQSTRVNWRKRSPHSKHARRLTVHPCLFYSQSPCL